MSGKNLYYEITTRMDKEDYRKFSHLTIFRKKYKTLSLILVLAAIGAAFGSYMDERFSLPEFLIIWVILILTAYAAIFLRVEYKAFNWMNQVRAGLAGVRQTILFYENYLIAEQDNIQGSNKIKYDSLHQVLETSDYYIVYASVSRASVIRKKDIDAEDRDGFHRFLKAKLGSRYQNLIKDPKK